MKWRWEARQKHWGDWQEIAKSLGFLDGRNKVRFWSGPEFWAQFESRGHDDTDFDSCCCGKGLQEQMIGS